MVPISRTHHGKKHLFHAPVTECSRFACNQFQLTATHRIPYRETIKYSETCIKWPLKNRQNKDLNDKWSKKKATLILIS